jgi:RNA polymerase sigma factor (sigma-70 family)
MMESNHFETESDIIEGCVLGNPRMQRILYETFSAKMYALCIRYADNTDDAQDILQDGFVKVFGNIGKFKGTGSFEGWIRRIMVNTAIEHFRKKNTLQAIDEKTENQLADEHSNIFNLLETKELLEIIKSMPAGYRTVFNLYAVEGYTHKEIAAMMNLNEGTSKSQYARAKLWLQEKIKKMQLK